MNFLRFLKKQKFGTGAVPDEIDVRDYPYEEIFTAGEPVDWNKGYDIETEIKCKIPFKNQDGSSSCVGQGWSYYTAVLNAVETGIYEEVSAKAYYAQIALPGGGAMIRDGGKLTVDWGAVAETLITSYKNGSAPDESFMRDLSWKNTKVDDYARKWQAKEYRFVSTVDNMDIFAMAIRDNHGIVGGVYGENNGTWSTNEPQPPVDRKEWAHCLFFGKFGTDDKGRYIATPNSWGTRGNDALHPDGWQKIRAGYFTSEFMFNPWTLVDKPNTVLSAEIEDFIAKNEKKIIIEAEGPGRKGIIIGGVLRPIIKERTAEACLYALATNGFGVFVNTDKWNGIPKADNF